jgi:hypothetical protein
MNPDENKKSIVFVIRDFKEYGKNVADTKIKLVE